MSETELEPVEAPASYSRGVAVGNDEVVETKRAAARVSIAVGIDANQDPSVSAELGRLSERDVESKRCTTRRDHDLCEIGRVARVAD
jgi:hypothetical protein